MVGENTTIKETPESPLRRHRVSCDAYHRLKKTDAVKQKKKQCRGTAGPSPQYTELVHTQEPLPVKFRGVVLKYKCMMVIKKTTYRPSATVLAQKDNS